MQSYDDLAAVLGIPKSTLAYFAYALSDEQKYISFSIPKRNGQGRSILAPIGRLKQIQRKIAVLLKDEYHKTMPYPNHGFGKEKDIISNAASHLGRRYIFKCDISDFYPSLSGARVFGVLTKRPFSWSDDVAHLVTMLCTYKDFLPQGAPTSPVLSNLIARKLDKRLMTFSKESGGFYTRYVDDITISYNSLSRLQRCIGTDGRISIELETIFEEENFSINHRKTRNIGKNNRQAVTGIVINEKLNLDRKYIKEVRNLVFIITHHGEKAASTAFKKKNRGYTKYINIRKVIEGKLRFIERVRGSEDSIFLKLVSTYQKFNPEFTPIVKEKRNQTHDAYPRFPIIRILAEGKTDYIHLDNAITYYQKRSQFLSLDLDLTVNPKIEGNKDLDGHIKVIETTNLGNLHIAIYDADDEATNNRYKGEFTKINERLYALILPRPKHIADGKPFCIEMMYKKEDLLMHDSNHRRVFLTEEFDNNTNYHKKDRRYTTVNKNWGKLIIDDKVLFLESQESEPKSVNLRKVDFANFIRERLNSETPPDIYAFYDLFSIIERIATEYNKKEI